MIINNKVNINYTFGYETDLITLDKVGYLINITVKWKQK